MEDTGIGIRIWEVHGKIHPMDQLFMARLTALKAASSL